MWQGHSKLWQIALWCWLILALAVAVRNCVRPHSHTVYPVFAEGARHWWAGQSLYHAEAERDLFRYSPAFAVMMTPFASLDDRTGSVLWSWCSLLIYFVGLRRLMLDLLPHVWSLNQQAVFLVLALAGGLSGLWNGQSNALLIGLVLWGCSGWVRQRWWQAAACWSIAILVKLPLAAVVLLFAALRPRPLLGRLAVMMTLGLLMPFLTRPADQVVLAYQEWVAQLVSTSSVRWPGYRDAWLVWELVQSPVPAGAYRAVQLAAAGVTLAGSMWFRQRGGWRGLLALRVLGLGVAWLMVLGPATEFATYVWLAPLVSWAVIESWRTGRNRALASTAYLLTMVVGCGHFDAWFGSAAPLLLPGGTMLFVTWLVKEEAGALWRSAGSRQPRASMASAVCQGG